MKLAAALTLGALFAVWGGSVAHAAGAPARTEFHRSYPLSTTGAFTLNDATGSVRIIGWEKNSVQIDALECAPTSDDLKNLVISVDSKPDVVNVQTTLPQASLGWFSWVRLLGWSTWCNERPQVDYTVHVPRRARVALTSAGADIEVVGPVGPLNVETASGDISAADIGDVSVLTQSGDTTLTRIQGKIAVTTTSGEVLFNDASGDLTVNSTSGEVRLYRVSGKALVNTTSGDITARALRGIARLSSTSGDVSVTLVRGKGIALSASTVSGDLHSDVPMRSGAPVDVRTISGDISVRSL